MNVKFCLAFPREAVSVPVMRRVLGDTLRNLGVVDECIGDLLVAVTEACTNVLRHGGKARRYEVVTSVGPAGCLVEVVDSGPGLGARRGAPDPHPSSGHGAQLSGRARACPPQPQDPGHAKAKATARSAKAAGTAKDARGSKDTSRANAAGNRAKDAASGAADGASAASDAPRGKNAVRQQDPRSPQHSGQRRAAVTAGRRGCGSAPATRRAEDRVIARLPESGRGLQIMRALVDDVTLQSGPGRGTVVSMRKRLAWRRDAPLAVLSGSELRDVG